MKILKVLFLSLICAQLAFANQLHNLLSEKPDTEKKEIIGLLLNGSGKECGDVIRVYFQGFDKENSAYWNAECSSGFSFAVQFTAEPDSNMKVLTCEYIKALGVECFKAL